MLRTKFKVNVEIMEAKNCRRRGEGRQNQARQAEAPTWEAAQGLPLSLRRCPAGPSRLGEWVTSQPCVDERWEQTRPVPDGGRPAAQVK